MIDRTKQKNLELETSKAEKSWQQQAKKNNSLQNRMTKLKMELKESKKEQDNMFKDFQRKQKDSFAEKQYNDRLHFKEKAEERRKEKQRKEDKKKLVYVKQ